jgi:hypothetical protein
MEDKHLPLPPAGKPIPAVDQAFQIAREKLAHIDNVSELCRKSGAIYNNNAASRLISLEFLGRPYTVSLLDGEIISAGDTTTLSAREKLLVLHYLLTAQGTPPKEKLITFQELPDGHVYYPTFMKRSVQALVSNFGSNPSLLLPLAEKLGGVPDVLGDVSTTIYAFPRVPVTIVLWKSDEEFEARGNILFDAGISDYLPTEDITILCETITWKLVKSKPVR